MDYKFTFQDGSEALMHHGTKGMKWGVWNAETAARYNASHYNSPTQRQVDKATRKLNAAKSNLDGSQKSRRKYEKAEKHYWRTVSGKNAAIKEGLASSLATAAGVIALGGGVLTGTLLAGVSETIDPKFVDKLADGLPIYKQNRIRREAIETGKQMLDTAFKTGGITAASGAVSGVALKTAGKYSGRNKAHKTVEAPKNENNKSSLLWSSEKKQAFNEAFDKHEKAWNYEEWNRNFDPGYSKDVERKLQKDAAKAEAKFRSL